MKSGEASISCRNASVTPLGLQLDAEATYSVNNSVPPGLPYGEPDHHVARIVLGVDNSGGYDSAPGLLAIRVDADFQDTMGNALGSPWQMTVVTTN